MPSQGHADPPERPLPPSPRVPRERGDWLSSLSAELRTPLAALEALARQLSDAGLPPRQAEQARSLASCARILADTAEGLRELSQATASTLTLAPVPTHLPSLLGQVADIYRARALDLGLSFHVQMDPTTPAWIVVDPRRLRQVLMYLVGHALHSTQAGGFSLQLKSRSQGEGGVLQISITDAGLGLSPQGRNRLLKGGPVTEMVSAREIVAHMGGQLAVATAAGVGSTLTLTLPVTLAQAPQAGADTPLASPPAPQGPDILVAEDDPVNQLVIQSLLAKLGYRRVTVVPDGAKALERCREESFDLVLMDCSMPVMDGLEATRLMRAEGFDQPIVALTGDIGRATRKLCLAMGMNDRLTKPIDPQLLAEKVTHWLGAERAGRSQA